MQKNRMDPKIHRSLFFKIYNFDPTNHADIQIILCTHEILTTFINDWVRIVDFFFALVFTSKKCHKAKAQFLTLIFYRFLTASQSSTAVFCIVFVAK